MLYALYYGLVLALLVLRRWRHLIVWLVVWIVASNVTLGLLIARRPRPFGVDFQTSWGGWGGWALPARRSPP